MKPIILLGLILFSQLITPIYASTDNSKDWNTKASMQKARGHLGVAAVKGKIYAIGGDRVNLMGNCIGPSFGNVLNTTEEYDPTSDTWTFKTPMPTPRTNFGIAVYQNKIYCIGGFIEKRQPTGVNEVYDPATDTWETKTSMPTARWDLQANVVNGKIYLVGGKNDFTSLYLNINEVYDPSTDTWSTKKSAPNRITSGASAAVNANIYFLATSSSLDLGPFIQIYNPKNDSWIVGARSPTYGDWSTTAVATTQNGLPQKIVFFSESSTCIYFPSNNNWAFGTEMPSSRGFAGAVAIDDRFYVIGGIPAPFIGYIVMTASTAKTEQYVPDKYNPIIPDTKIYIRADGSIVPSTANITTSDNVVYTFTGNNSERMIIERDNIIVNGNGFFLQGTGSYGIALYQRHHVTISNLTITGFQTAGIGIESSINNAILENNIESNLNDGIRLYSGASNNLITRNTIKSNKYMSGIHFYSGSKNNIVSLNNITNSPGIIMEHTSDNVITNNDITFGLNCFNSSNNRITENSIYSSPFSGIVLRTNSNNNYIFGNCIKDNKIGIEIENSSGNKLFHNNFVDNQVNAKDNSINIWDNGYPSGGNHWSNYNGTDKNNDGVGDNPHLIGENLDSFPLVAPITIFDAGVWESIQYYVDIISNSTVSNFSFSPEEDAFLRFDMKGKEGTKVICRLTIPKDMLNAENEWIVLVDNILQNFTVDEDNKNSYIHFTYNYNYISFSYQDFTKNVDIIGTTAIPEFPSWTLLIILVSMVAVTVLYRRKLLN